MSNAMTPKHPRWDEFLGKLEGPGACNFRKRKGNTTWKCKGGMDKTFARRILAKMGFDDGAITKSLAWFEAHGGHCDCEILFNCADR